MFRAKNLIILFIVKDNKKLKNKNKTINLFF
jgi:hypothetical protein